MYRRRNSEGQPLGGEEVVFNGNTGSSEMDRTADVVTLTPVQLQSAVACLRTNLEIIAVDMDRSNSSSRFKMDP